MGFEPSLSTSIPGGVGFCDGCLALELMEGVLGADSKPEI